MKSKETCLTRHLQVQPRSHLAGDTCQSLVRELLKHLLYMRNQIPGLFEALDWQIQASYKLRRTLSYACYLTHLTDLQIFCQGITCS